MSYVESAGVVTRWAANTTVASSGAVDTGTVDSTLTFGSAGGSGTGGGLGDDTFTIIGPTGGWGTRRANPLNAYDQRVHTIDAATMQYPVGMGPFFSTVLPDGTIALPMLQLTVSQVPSTGTTMGMGFFHPDTGYYTVTVPTTLGVTDTYSVNSITGVVDTAGGADLSDTCLVYDGDTPVLFGLSAYFYRGWRVSTVGLYPVMPAFVLSASTGRWAYDAGRSIFAATLRASHASGPSVWPNKTNFYGETVTDGLLPAEMVTLPQSGHIAVSIYAPRTTAGKNWGSVAVINPATKAMTAWYEWPNITNTFGWATTSYTRDMNADPTSVLNDERVAVNHDVFMAPNETFNVVVYADSGTWKVSYNGVQTAAIAVGAWAADVRVALEAVIGVGKVSVRESRPFLVGTYVVYEVELIGSLAHTDLSAVPVTIITTSLVNNGGSVINRWKHGGSGLTDQAGFPFSELSYNAGAGTLTLKTVPIFPQHGTEDPSRGEATDSTAGMCWYTITGDLVVAVTGHNANPQMFTSFTGYGLHVYVKPSGGDRAYITSAAPVTGWEARYGEARPTPDTVTTPIHQNGNAFMLGLCEDQATGGLLSPCASGLLIACQPHGHWQARSGRLVRPGTFAATGDVTANWTAGNGHAIAYNGTETAMSWTGASTTDGLIFTPTGTSGLPITAEQIGDVVTFAVEAKAAATRRLIRMACRFWGPGGAEVAGLTGYGSSVSFDTTGSYRRIVGAALIPTGTSFLSFQIEVLDPSASEVHYFRKVDVQLAPYWSTPALNDAGTFPLYDGQAGGSWCAKGFVDPETRMAWFPYLQVMSEATARTGRFPSWLVRVNTADLFEIDRRPDPRVMTSTRWTQSNPVLEVAETGRETNTGKQKVGDGVTDWVTLAYTV